MVKRNRNEDKMNNWKDIDKEKPLIGECVLTFWKDAPKEFHDISFMIYCGIDLDGDNIFRDNNGGFLGAGEITHWMRIEKPLKLNKDKRDE